MDTGYPALIPEPLHNHETLKASTIPSPTNQDIPSGRGTQADLTGSPPTTEKVS